MSHVRRLALAEEVQAMFYHAYDGYMQHAFPKDELRPLSCTGIDRFGGVVLTLVDSLDMLVLLENYTEFARVVDWLGDNLIFDKDTALSVFEINIRVMGGLLSAHHFAEKLLPGYTGKLLAKAVELGDILMVAFNTPTGIPFNEINPQKGPNMRETTTCPAAAGTLLLEFGYLSALTGNCKYMMAARRALDSLWMHRSKIGLWGTVIDVFTGDWRISDADIGASIDSLYEYLFKSYAFFDDEEYLEMFEEAYESVQKYLKRSDWHVKANCHTGQTEKWHVNSLQAFWPGMQVLAGNVLHGIASWNRFHCLHSVYGFIPERIALDSRTLTERGYPLRPEFVESTAFLFEATGNHRYLDVAEDIVKRLQNLTRTPCGFAAVRDVATGLLEDKMDSFMLAETLKYLYLMFQPKDTFHIRRSYIFNTEAHPLPISTDIFNAHAQCMRLQIQDDCDEWNQAQTESSTPLPRQHTIIPEVRQKVHWKTNLDDICVNHSRMTLNTMQQLRRQRVSMATRPSPRSTPKCPVALAAEMAFGVEPHDKDCLVIRETPGTCERNAGIAEGTLQIQMDQGVIGLQMLGSSTGVKVTQTDEGVLLTGINANDLYLPALPFSLKVQFDKQAMEVPCTTAQFGPQLSPQSTEITDLVLFHPSTGQDGCSPVTEELPVSDTPQTAIIFDRGNCPFQRKVEHGQAAGAALVIIADNEYNARLFHMSSDFGTRSSPEIVIPSVFIKKSDALFMKERLHAGVKGLATLSRHSPGLLRSIGINVLPLGQDAVLLRRWADTKPAPVKDEHHHESPNAHMDAPQQEAVPEELPGQTLPSEVHEEHLMSPDGTCSNEAAHVP